MTAVYVMKRLVSLRMRCELSIFVVAHDTSRSVDHALITLADREIRLHSEDDAQPAKLGKSEKSGLHDPLGSSGQSDLSDPSYQHSRPVGLRVGATDQWLR